MKIARIIMVLLIGMDLGMNLVKHKEKKTGSASEYNFWVSCISNVILIVLLYFGGFWR